MNQIGRRSRLFFAAVLALTALGGDALLTQAQTPASNRRIAIVDGREVVEGEVMVRYRPSSGRIERERAEFQANSEPAERIGRGGARRLRSRHLSTQQMLANLRANPDVEVAEPNFIIRAHAVANDPSMDSLWGLLNTGQVVDGVTGVPGADIDAVPAWDIATGTRANVVAVIDTGIDFNHPDLAANVFTAPRQFTANVGSVTITCPAGSHGFNALTNSCTPVDDSGHGTHVAGIIGAVGNNSIGVTGVSWTANLMALKVLDADGAGTTSDAIKAIDFAVQAKAALGADANIRVLNASWGGPNFSQLLSEAIDRANSADMLFVGAAGSDTGNNDTTPHYPASYTNSNVVSVAASDNTGALAAFSNYGATSVHLAAPGGSTLSTLPNNDYGYLGGTSMSAAFVSGAAALILSECPLSTSALKTQLLSRVDPEVSMNGKTVSGGRLNVNNAIRACSPDLNPPSITVNGSAGAQTVASGATMTIAVANGPGHVYDWVTIVPVGSANNANSGVWFLNGTSTPPATGRTSATFGMPAPTTPGQYEARFLASGGYQRLATSGVITVGSGSPSPAPVLNSISPASVNENSAFTLTATGSSFTTSSQIWLNGAAKTTTYVSSTTLTAAISASDVATAGSRSITVVTPSPGGGTSAAVSLTVVASTSGLTFTVNGTAGAQSVAPGATMTIAVANGPGHVYDWVTIVPVGSANNANSGVWFLNGTSTPPATGRTSATFGMPAPTTPGQYEARFLASGGYQRLATSGVITVGSGSPAPAPVLNSISPASVNENSTFTLTATGSSFTTSSQIWLNGAAKTTTYVSSTTLTAAISASDVATAGSRSITVVTPSPGGGTSAAVSLTVVASTSGLTFTVNGSAGAQSVAPGATMTIAVANGPGHVYDWVTIVPVGSANNANSGVWFLNGTSTPPATGRTSATFGMPAPTTPGQYEARFLASGGYQRLATSGVITVGSGSPSPAPVLNSISPASVNENSTFTLTATGSSFTTSSQIWLNGAAKTTTYVSSTTLTAAISASDVATAGSRSITVVTPSPGGGTSAAVSLTVVASTSGLTFTVNGTAGAQSVAPGATMTIAVANGPGHVYDWVTIVPVGSANNANSGVWFLNGTSTPPATGRTSATFGMPAPTTAGNYEARFLASGGYQRLATSGVITVGSPAPAPAPVLNSISPASVSENTAFTLTASGTGFVAGSQIWLNGAAKTTTYVSSTTLTAAIPASDVATAGSRSITVVTPSPGGGTSAAVSLTVVATASGLTFTVNGSAGAQTVAPGATLTIAVAGGPGHVYDWVTIVPVGSANNAYSGVWFLNGTSTPPASGLTSATFGMPAPTTPGQYEARFLASGGYQRLATSGVITVGSGSPPPAATGPTITVNGSSGSVSVARGASITIAVANGPAHVYDWVTIVPVGSADTASGSVWFLSGTSTPPPSGLSSATFAVQAPTTPGSYEARFLASGRYGRLATSGVITVP